MTLGCCVGCHYSKPLIARNRCRRCYQMQYRHCDYGDEPTADEVEALIAEQMRPENLPPWRWADVKKQRRGCSDGWRVPVVRLGL